MDEVLVAAVAVAALVAAAYLAFLYVQKRKSGARKPTKDDIYPMW